MLTECHSYNFLLWDSTLSQPELEHLVLFVSEAVARVNQFLKVSGKNWLEYLQKMMQFSGATLSGSFKAFKFLKRLDIYAFIFKKCIILRDFLCGTKILKVNILNPN